MLVLRLFRRGGRGRARGCRRVADAYHCRIDNVWVREEYAFELYRCCLEAADFDQLLLPIDSIPQFGLAVAINDVAGLEVSFLVVGLGVSFGIVEVPGDNGGTADAELALDVIARYVLAGVIYQPT